jgi:hypothetical protein
MWCIVTAVGSSEPAACNDEEMLNIIAKKASLIAFKLKYILS